MTDKNKNLLRLTYFMLISVALVTVAVLLMAACVNIYRIGDFPFTRELVAYEFDRIAIPVYVCLGLVAVGFVLHPLLPETPESDKDRNRMIVGQLRRTTDLSLCPADVASGIQKEQSRQARHRRIALCLWLVGLAAIVWYALSYDRFSMEDINGDMARSMRVFVPALAVPAGYGVFSLFFNRGSYLREMALYRQVPKEAKIAAPTTGEKPWVSVARYAVLTAAIGLIVGGWLAGGWVDVLTKAINICTECVGLG